MRNASGSLGSAGILALLLLAAPAGAAGAAPGLPEQRTLPNGLQVVTLEDHTLPLCAVTLWVRAGSKDEIESSAGYAHFLEHMVQRGGGSVRAFEYQRLANRWGGTLNVRANYDRTYITMTGVPSALGDLIGAVAGMAFSAALEDQEIDQELGSFTQEIKSYYDEPSSVAFLESVRATFPGHPYRYPPLGNFKTVGTLKHDALMAFYKNLYVPNNMSLVVAGDIDPARAAALVDAAFGKPARSATLPPRPAVPRSFPGHDDIEKRLEVKEPWVNLAFAAPGYRHPDRPAFEVIAQALGDAGGAWVSSALIQSKAAATARVTYYRLEDGGMLYFGLVPSTRELSYPAARAALQAIVDFKSHGLSEADLRSLVERLLREERLRAEQLEQRAEGLGEAALFGGLRYYWDLPEAYARLTPAEIARVASTYLVGDNFRLVLILPKDTPPLLEQQKDQMHETLELLGHAAPGSSPGLEQVAFGADQAAKITSEAWGNWRDAAGLKDPQRQALGNGMTVVVQQDRRHSLAAISLHLPFGSGDDPPGKEGLANLAAHLLTGGAFSSGRGEALRLGGKFVLLPEVDVSRDLTEIRFLVSPPDLKPALDVLALALRQPLYTEASLKTVQTSIEEAMDRRDANPHYVSLQLFREKVYEGHPYAHPPTGLAATLKGLTPADLTAFRARHLRPAGVVLAIAGDPGTADALRLAREIFAGWEGPAPEGATGEGSARKDAGEPRRSATDHARAGEFSRNLRTNQSSVVVGVPGVAISRPEFEGIRMLGTALTVLAFEDMVFKRRAAFSASAVPEGLREGGSLAIEVTAQPRRRDEAVFDVQHLMRRLALEDLPPKDLEEMGRFQAGRETAAAQGVLALSSLLGYREVCGLGAAGYRQGLVPPSGWSPGRLKELAARYLRPEAWIVVQVGPAPR
jgi:zinc protease